MGNYNITTIKDPSGIYISSNGLETVRMDNKPGKTLMNPAEVLLSSLGACKSMGFYDMAAKYNMDIKNCIIEIKSETGRGPKSEFTNRPVSMILSIEYVYKIESTNTDEELENFLHYVNGACTVSNSLNKDIKQSYRFERI